MGFAKQSRQFCMTLAMAVSLFSQYGQAAESTLAEQLQKIAKEPSAVYFTPPEGWHFAEMHEMPASVKVMVVGQSKQSFPPTINLSIENYSGNLKQYLKLIKSMNESRGTEWKDLGTIRTEAGDASLSQVDLRSEWGNVRMMHVILVKNGSAYIVTAASLRDEFAKNYKDFFASLRSFRINKDMYEMIPDSKRRKAFEQAVAKLKMVGTEETSSTTSENASWGPFKDILAKDFADMSPEWHEHVMTSMHNELQG